MVNQLKNRSVVELIALMFAAMITLGVPALGTTACIIEIRDPTADTSDLVGALTAIITLILGSLLGIFGAKAGYESEQQNGSQWAGRREELYEHEAE